MFKYGISCALTELPLTQPVSLRGTIDEVCRTASMIGYDAIELHIRDPKNYDPIVIKKTAANYGLTVCAVANGMEYTVGGLSLIDDDKEKSNAAYNRILEHCDFAAALNAKLIIGIMRGNIPPKADTGVYISRFADVLGRICDYAENKNTGIVLESILRYINNYLCGVKETMDFISAQNRKNLSLHIDTHSMAMEEQNLKESILYCKNKALGYVHYSDNNRRYPGAGALDFSVITEALIEIGYKDFITVECLPWPTAEESAKKALNYIKNIAKH